MNIFERMNNLSKYTSLLEKDNGKRWKGGKIASNAMSFVCNSSIRPASGFSFFPVSTDDLFLASATHVEGQIKNKSIK